MEVKASVEHRCPKPKVVRRKRVVYVLCEDPKRKQQAESRRKPVRGFLPRSDS